MLPQQHAEPGTTWRSAKICVALASLVCAAAATTAGVSVQPVRPRQDAAHSLKQTCPFCPHAKTAKVFGAAASGSAIPSMGELSPNETFAMVAAAGIEILDLTAFKCEEWERLPAQLAAAAAVGVKLVAGFESESKFEDFCPNFKGANGLIDWVGLSAQLANLSLAYPNLVGYRFDDFIGCCHLQQYGNQSFKPDPSVYYAGLPQDTERMQAAAKAVNPNFMMLAVLYDAQLAFQSPFSFSFGQRAWLQPALPSDATAGHHGSFLPAGISVTMQVAFELQPALNPSSSHLQLDFLETTQFLYGVATAELLEKSHGLVRRQLSINQRCILLDHDLANITDSLFPPSTPQAEGRVFVHSINITSTCLNAGGNVLEWELRGTANLTDWYTTHKNFISVWDIFLEGPMVPGGRALIGNGSWANVRFDFDDQGSVVPATTQGQRPELFGGSNRHYSQLPQLDGILLCWKQMDPVWNTEYRGGSPEQQLYRQLLRSARRAFAGPDAVLGRQYSVFSTHFGMFDWKNYDAAIAANPQLSRAGISPQTVYAQMMDDAWLSDGIFIWWDLIGLPDDMDAQRGIFSPQVGRHTVMDCPSGTPSWEYLQLSSVEGVGLLRGWFQSVTTNGTGVPAGNISVSMLQGYKDIRTVSFRTVVEVKPADSDWMIVYQRGSNDSCADAMLCNTSALNTLSAPWLSCSVACSGDSVNVTMALSNAVLLRVKLEVVHDAGGNFGVCTKATSAPSIFDSGDNGTGADASGEGTATADSTTTERAATWSFYSGIDPMISSVVQEERKIVNATRIIQQCNCNENNELARHVTSTEFIEV